MNVIIQKQSGVGVERRDLQLVFVLHGLGRTCWSMARTSRCLRRAGFDVRPWRYPSTRAGVQVHADRLIEALRRADADPRVSAIHFVTHSMGGIVVRAALSRWMPAHLGRIVMLAPPNRGSDVALRLAPYLGWLWRPLPELACNPGSYVCRLATPPGLSVGIIAAAADTKVRLHQTHLPGEADHLIVDGGHTFIMNRAEVCRQVLVFLRNGRFDRLPGKSHPATGHA